MTRKFQTLKGLRRFQRFQGFKALHKHWRAERRAETERERERERHARRDARRSARRDARRKQRPCGHHRGDLSPFQCFKRCRRGHEDFKRLKAFADFNAFKASRPCTRIGAQRGVQRDARMGRAETRAQRRAEERAQRRAQRAKALCAPPRGPFAISMLLEM